MSETRSGQTPPPPESYSHVLVALRWATKDGIDAWARLHGFSYPYIYRVLNTGVPPSSRLCKALGFERKVTFERAGS